MVAQQQSPTQVEDILSFLKRAAVDIPVTSFLLDLCLTGMCAYILSHVYSRCGRSLSNRKDFAENFLLLAVTTMLIISIVKSSIALSLGLVGALSIVRFRAAIKEPEELTYLFLTIAIGLGFGGNQRFITLTAFFVIIGILLARSRGRAGSDKAMYLNITCQEGIGLESIAAVIGQQCSALNVIRVDESKDSMDVSFQVNFKGLSQLDAARTALKQTAEIKNFSFLDTEGLL